MRRLRFVFIVLLLTMLPIGAVNAGSVCPTGLDSANCQALQTALANLPKMRAFNVSYNLGISKINGSKTTGLAGAGIGFFDLAITGQQQRQSYLSMEFDTLGTDKPQKSKVEFHLVSGQWFIKTAEKPNASRFQAAPTTPLDYQKFLVLALSNGVKGAKVGQLDHALDGQFITAITVDYDAPTLLRALFTGQGRSLVKAALGSQLVPDLDAGLEQLIGTLSAKDTLQAAYLVGPDHYFHGIVLTVKHQDGGDYRLTLRFSLEITQIGTPYKFNEPTS